MERISALGAKCLAWLLLLLLTIETSSGQDTTTVYTIAGGGGNAPGGTPCVFPFRYKSITYTTCTTINNKGVYWCSTTAEYNKKWGNCGPRSDLETVDGQACAIPFNFNEDTFFACTTDGSARGEPWCSLIPTYVSSSGQWGYCRGEGSTTQEPGVSPVDCNAYASEEGVQSLGAYQADSSFDSIEKCKNLCTSIAVCLAVDFNTKKNLCYVHENAAILANRQDAELVNQYTKISCSSTAAQPTAPGTSPSTTTRVTSLPPAGCVDDFDVIPGQLSYNGVRFVGVSGLSDCKKACVAASDCVGFDFKSTDGACWKHTEQTIGTSNSAVRIDQYLRLPCASSPTNPVCVGFEKVEGLLSYSGTPLDPSANTVAKCQAICLSEPTCVAFDFDKNKNTCFWHTDGYLSNTVPVSSVDQYRRVEDPNCATGETTMFTVQETTFEVSGGTSTPYTGPTFSQPESTSGMTSPTPQTSQTSVTTETTAKLTSSDTPATTSASCVDTFDKLDNTRSNGGSVDAGARRQSQCRNACLALGVCLGYTWMSGSKTCYIHTMQSDLTDLTFDSGADFYTRVPCVIIPSSSIAQCMDTFQFLANTLAYGGTEMYVSTVPECEALCRQDINCVAFDFTASLRCYLHLSPASLETTNLKVPANNVDQYRRVFCGTTPTSASSTATITPDDCQDEFVMTSQMMYFSGMQDTGVSSIEGCTAGCLAQSNCLAFDYNRRNDRCFYFFDQDLLLDSNSQPANNIDHYRRVFLCRSSATALSSTQSGIITSTEVQTMSPTPVTGTPEPGCSMNRRNNRNAQGGINVGTMTEDNCRQSCWNDESCMAADWNKNTRQCYKHVVLTPSASSNCCTRYEKECDECKPGYTRYPNMQAVGGIEVPDAGLESLCAQTCSADFTCTAFDFNTVTGKCYLHLTSTLNIIDTVGFDHYSWDGCQADCYDLYDYYNGKQVLGGDYRREVTSVEECRAMCNQDDMCTGFDWNRNKNRCYIHVSDYDQFINNQNVDNYKKVDCPTVTPPIITLPTQRPPTAGAPTCQADIVLMVDSSGSIEEAGFGNYAILKQFLKDFVSSLPIGSDQVRVALIIWSDYAEVIFDFDDYNNLDELIKAIELVPYIGGETHTSQVFQRYIDELRGATDRGNRLDVYDLLLMITDGNTTNNDRNLLYSTVSNMMSQNPPVNTILGVGIGRIDLDEMRKLVSPPFSQNYVDVDQFGMLTDNLDRVLLGTECSGVTIPQPTPPTNNGLAVFTFRRTTSESASFPVNFQEEAIDDNNNFNPDNNVLTVPSDGVYFFAISVGVPDRTKVDYSLQAGGRETSIVRNTLYHDGVDVLSKDAIVTMYSGQKASVESAYATYSDLDKATSFSAFSISDTMNPLIYFFVSFTSGQVSVNSQANNPLKMNYRSVENNAGAFDANNDYFTCPIDGYYLFSFSAYIPAGSTLQLELRVGSDAIFELRRGHTNHRDGGDTMSRTVLANCEAGTRVEVYLVSGTIQGRSDHSTSFMGFLYNPQASDDKVAFALSRPFYQNIQQDRATILLPFISKDIEHGIDIPDYSEISEITCSTRGIYFLSLTLEASPDMRVNVFISVDGLPIFGIYRSSVWHGRSYDTLSRSAMVVCDEGQVIRVNIRGDSAVGNSPNVNIYGNTFFGILVYRT